MTDDEPTHSISLDHIDDSIVDTLVDLLSGGIGGLMVSAIMRLVPDASIWRLTITGDMTTTVNRLELRGEGNGYTRERGSVVAGARTIRQDDGTFDIVVSTDVFSVDESVSTADEFIQHAVAAGPRIAAHEAGHAALALREEDAASYSSVAHLSPTDGVWRGHIAAHIDDYRIEKWVHAHYKSTSSNVDEIGGMLAWARDEFTGAHLDAKRGGDIDEAVTRTLYAAAQVMRVFAYLSAELGLDSVGEPVHPGEVPEGWDEYVAPMWDEWSRLFHQLPPADEETKPDDLAGTHRRLCELASRWLTSVGVEFRMLPFGRTQINWLKDSY